MPRQFTYREVTGALEEKLGIPFRSGGERTGWFYHEGVKVTRVTVPHVHGGTFPPGTIHGIRMQTLLSTTEFEALLDCSMTGAGYLSALRSKGKIPPHSSSPSERSI